MNLTVMRLTMRGLLGRRRAALLVILPVLLLGLAGLTRWASGGTPEASASLAGQFAMGTLLPLMCLLISTGVMGAEIDDGSIVYMLAKPIPRRTIVLSKLAVALAAAVVFAVLPTLIAVEIAGDEGGRLGLAFAVSTALAAVAYTALFVALSVGEKMLGDHAAAWGVAAEVGLVTGVVMLALTTIAAVFVATKKLETLRLGSGE